MKTYREFRAWLDKNTDYSERTKGNIVSRVRRAEKIYPISADPIYIFNLTQTVEFQNMTVSVRSQIKKAVKIYSKYMNCERTCVR